MSDRWRVGLRGARDALLLPAWVIGLAMLGVGALAHDIGMPLGATVLSTPLIWAGPAQFVLFGGIAAGGAALSMALAVSLTSMRLLPMALSLLPMMERPGGTPLAMRLLLAHLLVVTTWIESIRRFPSLPRGEREAWYIGFALACVVVSTGMTAACYLLGAALPQHLAAGFLFLTPMFFALSLVASAARPADWLALAGGVLLLPVAMLVAGPGFDLLLAGLVGGTAAWLWHRRHP